jgi:hypothetical protein
VESVTVRDCSFDFEENAPALVPAMAEEVPAVRNQGIIAQFIRELNVENVSMDHIDGDMVRQID